LTAIAFGIKGRWLIGRLIAVRQTAINLNHANSASIK
jgi:hypothetical protein